MEIFSESYGSLVFNDHVMKQRLPEAAYKSLHATIRRGAPLDADIAAEVAAAMKDWAIENGATHYTHWFQPLTGSTSEKHDSFIEPAKDGRAILEFSAKALIRGEPDASSFPSGGLRATCEARGYTAWDPTSYAFIKDEVLCIPTAFCSYSGEALDKKTPLLRSMATLNRQALRILKLFGKEDVAQVQATVGAEQEYFLVDRAMYERRKDLAFCGRTLFGAMPPKGQEMDDHYFGVIKPRVLAFMKELDAELWKLGVSAKTRHNEGAPAQHELAPLFTTANIAMDANQLTMEMMKKIAHRQGLECLLHEKPFKGVNGSGKHNNWSLSTNTGDNLLNPGKNPHDNLQFLLFLTAVLHAVDEYQDLLRISVTSAGNDHRLGAHEAPPAIISIFMGNELSSVIEAICTDSEYHKPGKIKLKLGVDVLPPFSKDNTDRNRTSPMAFTGNKFEFRMPGSNMSLSDANVVLNTAVAEVLRRYADELETAGSDGFAACAAALVRRELTAHKRIVFDGNGYTEEWKAEAAARGLLNLPSTPDALPYYLHPKNIALFESHGIFTKAEITARYEVCMEQYAKTLHIEALTMLDMARKQLIPAVCGFAARLAESLAAKRRLNLGLATRTEEELLRKVCSLTDALSAATEALAALIPDADACTSENAARFYRDRVLPQMDAVRAAADALEGITAEDCWPFPSYTQLLFGVN